MPFQKKKYILSLVTLSAVLTVMQFFTWTVRPNRTWSWCVRIRGTIIPHGTRNRVRCSCRTVRTHRTGFTACDIWCPDDVSVGCPWTRNLLFTVRTDIEIRYTVSDICGTVIALVAFQCGCNCFFVTIETSDTWQTDIQGITLEVRVVCSDWTWYLSVRSWLERNLMIIFVSMYISTNFT